MLRIVALVLLLFCAPASRAAPLVADLGRNDIQAIQAALTLTGDYDGAIDGQWGARSERAFRAFRQRQPATSELQAIRVLMVGFTREWRVSGWRPVAKTNGGPSHYAPMALVRDPLAHLDETYSQVSVDGGLQIDVRFQNEREVGQTHADWRSAHSSRNPSYVVRQGGLRITTAELASRERVYARSDRVGSRFRTLEIRATPEHYNRLRLIAASVRSNAAVTIRPPAGGPLHSLVAPFLPDIGPDSARPEPEQEASQPRQARSVLPPGTLNVRPRGSTASEPGGVAITGVYINPLDIMTATAVLDDCERPALSGGEPLVVLARDDQLRLAVLRSQTRNPATVLLSRSTRLGDRLRAVGHAPDAKAADPLLETVVAVLAVNQGGLLLAAPDLETTPPPAAGHIAFAAQHIPDDVAGWPLLDSTGALAGIMDRERDPGGLRRATTAEALARFLSASTIVFAFAETERDEVGFVLPRSIAGAVVLLTCLDD
ncbi:peptidoglycan-binding domain-containing protein [Vannielia litorea]|uniref:peptidoglycan-binding domain-containing protein n=1 Tax=Vannielia litorea TaxID=1217970 RepID=UPI001BCEF653|nr:hypothetical protein [Vannielia litorea]MBS8228898.1 hypothetical protein [Vannielia litorea]